MSEYHPPVSEMHHLLTRVLGFEHAEIDEETLQAVLEEAGKLAADVLAPLNKPADEFGAKLDGDKVTTAPGFKEAYKQYVEGGWNAVPFSPEFGGQGMPKAVAFPIYEMWQSANLSFSLCPLLNQGAIEAIEVHGSEEQKTFYLPKMIEGTWTGTMNLTEPQAGSDLGLLRSKAEPDGNGAYKVTGQKIFITFGEHDMAENIIHLVLARLPDAPEDVKGISLFIVPKFLEGGQRNALSCIGLEHKLGIHASPTCTMQFDGATGYLLGEPHQGLKCMFTMMNNARLSVGLQGVALAERAFQHASAYAAERVQGKSFAGGERITIDQHADVKRMLLSMKALTNASRALTYEAAIALDKAAGGDKDAQVRVDLLTPLVKSWGTDVACEVASLGVQVHGGMGFIEETGAAQYYRDARILPIYEGTNGIQAADLVFRKLGRDGGAAALSYIEYIAQWLAEPQVEALKEATSHMVGFLREQKLDEAAFASGAYLKGFAMLAGAAHLARMAASDHSEVLYSAAKLDAFYKAHYVPQALAALQSIFLN